MKTVHILSLLCSAISPCAVASTFTPFTNHTLSEPLRPYNCPPAPSAFFEAESRLLASEQAKDMLLLPPNVTIPAYVHVIAGSNNPKDGFVNETSILELMADLNHRFAPYGFFFELQGSDSLINATESDWTWDSIYSGNAKNLRKGSYDTLNIYTYRDMGGEIIGMCTFPETKLKYDGCEIDYRFMPPFRSSQVLIHEIGHWLGLKHTFQESKHIPANSSCLCQEDDNDGALDTPIHLNPQAFLPGVKEQMRACRPMSTCNNTDPVLNYMNYMPLHCFKEFTKSQVWMMRTWWQGRVEKAQYVDLGSEVAREEDGLQIKRERFSEGVPNRPTMVE